MTPTMTGFSLTRRTVLGALPATLLSQLAPIRWALAQDQGDFRAQLRASQDIAIGLANATRNATRNAARKAVGKAVGKAREEVDPERIATWWKQDYRGRKTVAEASLDLSQTQLREYVQGEFQETANAMVAREVRLIPKPQHIVPISTARTPSDGCPMRSEAIWDILLDSLGLLEEKALFREAMNAINGAADHVNRIENSTSEGNQGQAIDGFFDLLEFLLTGGMIVELARRLDDRLAKKFLRAAASRLVPFVGTGYAITALSLAVYRHWDRLFCER